MTPEQRLWLRVMRETGDCEAANRAVKAARHEAHKAEHADKRRKKRQVRRTADPRRRTGR